MIEKIVHTAKQAVKAIVLICGGRTFFAGADITEFGKPVQEPDLRQVIDLVESSPKPTIAAIHGTALGGGYELSLGCNYRVAVPSAKVGLPASELTKAAWANPNDKPLEDYARK